VERFFFFLKKDKDMGLRRPPSLWLDFPFFVVYFLFFLMEKSLAEKLLIESTTKKKGGSGAWRTNAYSYHPHDYKRKEKKLLALLLAFSLWVLHPISLRFSLSLSFCFLLLSPAVRL